MAPTRALGHLADLLVKAIRILVVTVTRSVVGLRWLAQQMHRQRTLGATNADAAKLYDVHALAFTGDMLLLTVLLWAPAVAYGWVWPVALAASLILAVLVGVVGRRVLPVILVGAPLLLRGALAIVAAQWASGRWWLLVALTALILPQWVAHAITLWRFRPDGAGLGRMAAYGFQGALVPAAIGLLTAWVFPGFGLWFAAVLLLVGGLMAFRIQAHSMPRGTVVKGDLLPPKHTAAPQQAAPPRQAQQRELPSSEHFGVYRPSSLDEE